MEKEIKKPYLPPVSTCTRVVLESPICADSDFQVQAPHAENGIEAQKVDTDFGKVNNSFTTDDWN